MTVPSMAAPPARRPGRRWFLLAALIAAAGLVPALLLLTAPKGTLEHRFVAGQPYAVRIDPSSPTMLWVRWDRDELPEVRCDLAGPRPAQLQRIDAVNQIFDVYEMTVDGERWRGAQTFRADPPGTYEMVCWGSGTAAGPDVAVGDVPWSYGLRRNPLVRSLTASVPLSDTGLALVFALPGVLVGLAIAVAVVLRRRASRPAW